MPLGLGVRRRQPKRVLGELGGGYRRATRARQGRSLLENSGDLGIRALGREREVAGAVERIRDDPGKASMCAPSLVRGHAVVDHRPEQRVREANRPVGALYHARGNCAIEDALADVQPFEELGGRTAHGRCEQQRLSCVRGQLIETRANQSFERLRNTERLRVLDVLGQGPGELERVERVATGRLVHG